MRSRKNVLALFFIAAVVLAFTSVLWAEDTGKININTASVEEIAKLEKIGPNYAERIVQYRKEYGPFEKPEDLMKVKGIGSKTFELNKNKSATQFNGTDRNNITKILDEAKVGLEYLIKCYPDANTFYYQVGDPEVDHRQGTRLPEDDELAERHRPAFVGFSRNELSKYAFTMALGHTVFKNIPNAASESVKYLQLAKRAYRHAKRIGQNHQDKRGYNQEHHAPQGRQENARTQGNEGHPDDHATGLP